MNTGIPYFKNLEYKLPVIERCCANCAFFQLSGDMDGKMRCEYMSSLSQDRCVNVEKYGCCKHFFSYKHSLALYECKSKDELDLKSEIYGIQLDELLKTEILDGFEEYEKATSKMQSYALKIENKLFERGLPYDPLEIAYPRKIDLKRISANGGIWMIERSQNFSRVNAYIKKFDEWFRNPHSSPDVLRDAMIHRSS